MRAFFPVLLTVGLSALPALAAPGTDLRPDAHPGAAGDFAGFGHLRIETARPLTLAQSFNRTPAFPAGAADGRIVVAGAASKVLTLRQAADQEGDALTYRLRNAPSWMVPDSTSAWEVAATPPDGAGVASYMIGLQATDAGGSGGTAEDLFNLDVIEPTAFSGWELVDGRLEFTFASGWCQGDVARRGAFQFSYAGSKVSDQVQEMPEWRQFSSQCRRGSVTFAEDATMDGGSHRIAYTVERSQAKVSVPVLASAGPHQYSLDLDLEEVLAGGALALASADAQMGYSVVDQDWNFNESASEVADGTALITLTLASAVASAAWSVHGAPAVGLKVTPASGSETTQAVVALDGAAVLDYEAYEGEALLAQATILARTAASESSQQAVFTNLRIVLVDVNEPPAFRDDFPEELRVWVSASDSGSVTAPAAVDPEEDALEYEFQQSDGSALPAAITFSGRVLEVAAGTAAGTYDLKVIASEVGNVSNSAEREFTLRVGSAGFVIDSAALGQLDQYTRTGTFEVQLAVAPAGEVTVGLASGLESQLRVTPETMIFDDSSWNTGQSATVELLDAALRDKSSRQIDVVVAVSDEDESDPAYQMAAAAVVPVQVDIENAAPVFHPRQRSRMIFENIGDDTYAAGTRVLRPVVATDIDNSDTTELAYMLDGASSLFGVDGDSGQITLLIETNLDHEDVDEYTITIKVADSEPAATRGHATVTVAIEVANVDEPPVLEPLADQYLIAGAGGEYTIPAAVDDDGQEITYRAGPDQSATGDLPDGITFDADSTSADFRKFTFAAAFSGTVTLWVEAMDPDGLFSVQDFLVATVPGGGILVDRDVSQLKTSRQQRKVTVGIALSLEPDSEPVTLTLESGNDSLLEIEPETMEFSASDWSTPQEAVASMTDAALMDKMLRTITVSVGVYQQASGDSRYQGSADLSLAVELDSVNQPPRFDPDMLSGLDLSIDEGLGKTALAADTNVGAPIDAVDDEDNAPADLVYELVGASAEFKVVSPADGQVQVQAKSGVNLNHEHTSGYTLTIQVADGDSGVDTATVRIAVNDVDETPAAYSGSGFAATGAGRDAVVLDWDNIDFETEYDPPDRGRIEIGYGGGGWQATMSLPVTAATATVSGLVAGVTYGLTIRWYSADGLTQATPDASAIVSHTTDTNSAPSLAAASRSLVEQVGDAPPLAAGTVLATVAAPDSDSDPVFYSIQGGADAALFAIGEQSGVISLARQLHLDHESKDSYTFMIQAQDLHGGKDSASFELMVTDDNDPPVLPDQPLQTATAGTAANFSVVAATDADSGDTHEYELVSVDGAAPPAWLTFTAATGAFAVGTGADAGTYTIAARAVEIGNSPNLASQVRDFVLAVAASGSTNTAPSFDDTSYGFELDENAVYAAGHVIGTVTATDADSDELTYRIRGADAAAFAITGSPGTISLREGGAFDHEDRQQYSFVVEVDDGNQGVVSAPVVVDIEDENELPQFPEIPEQQVIRGLSSTFVIPVATDPEGQSLAYSSIVRPGPWLAFVAPTRTFTVLPSAPAGLYTLVVAATESGANGLVGEQDIVLRILPAGSSGRPAAAGQFNQAPEFPAGTADGRIVVSGTSKLLSLRQAADPEGDSITYGLRNAPSWLVQSAVPWKATASPPEGEDGGTRLIGLQATDAGSGGTTEDFFTLDVIDPTEFSGWGLTDDGRIEFRFASGWCQGRVSRRGAIDFGYGDSRLSYIEPEWGSLNCLTPSFGEEDVTIGGDGYTLGYLIDREQVRISAPILTVAGSHKYDLAVEVGEVLEGGSTTLALDEAAAVLNYDVVNQDWTLAESSDEMAADTPLITLTLAGAGVASAAWSVHGSPRVPLKVTPVASAESTEAVVALDEAAFFDYETATLFVQATIFTRTDASESSQQAVFTNLKVMLTAVDEDPFFADEFADQRFVAGIGGEFVFHEAQDPEGTADLVYAATQADGSALAGTGGISFTAATRVFSVADTTPAGTYELKVTASEQADASKSGEQEFTVHVSSGGIVLDTSGLEQLTRSTRSSTFEVQLASAPAGEVTVMLDSSLEVQMVVVPEQMVFGSGNWNTSQQARVELLDAALEEKGGGAITVTVAVRDEQLQGDANYRMAAVTVVPVQVSISNAAPEFDEDQRNRGIFESFIDEEYMPGTPVGAPLEATDEDNRVFELSYMLVGESEVFDVQEDSGQIEIRATVNLSHEDASSHTITVSASDNEPEAIRGVGMVTVTITVVDFPEPPVLEPLVDQFLIEGQGGTYTIPAAVDQDETVSISYRAAPSQSGGTLPEHITFDRDYNSPGFRTFTFAPEFSGTVQLWVGAADSTGGFDLQSFQVITRAGGDIFAASGTSDLQVFEQRRQVTVNLVLSLAPDSQDVTLTLQSSDDSILEIDAATMVFSDSSWNTPQAVVASMTDVALAAKGVQTVYITVGVHDAASSDPYYQDTAGFEIGVLVDNSNLAPAFDIGALVDEDPAYVDETPGRGSLAADIDVGRPMSVYASDPDNDAADLTYSIVGESAEFGIDPDSGQLRIKSGAQLNYEHSSSRVVTVRVSDGDPDFPGHDEVLGRVFINDLDEKPLDYASHLFAVTGMSATAVTVGWNNDEFNEQYDVVDRGRIEISYGGGGWRATMELAASATVAVLRGLIAGVSYDLTLNWYSQDGITQDNPAVISGVMTDANSAPVFDDGASVFERRLDESVGAGSPTAAGTVLATIAADDADGNPISYSINGGADALFFAVDEQSGVVSLARDVRFDHEGKGLYTFMVQTQDSFGQRDRRQFRLVIDDVNEPPVLPDQPAQRAVAGTASSFTVVPATDPDRGDTPAYELVSVDGGASPAWLTFTAATGEFDVAAAADAGTYMVAVKAVETGRSTNLESPVRSFALAVAAADSTNSIPSFDAPLSFELREEFEVPSRRQIGTASASDADGDTLTYRMRGADSALFSIDPDSGRIDLRERMRFDREEKDLYVFVIDAYDLRGGVASAYATLTITDVNEAPQFGAIPDQRVVQGVYSTFMVNPAVDPEGRPLVYSASNPGPWLVFVSDTRTFTVLPSAPAGRYTLDVTAAESDSSLEAEREFVLNVQTAGNRPPEFPQSMVAFELLENRGTEFAPAGTLVGQVEAVDPDPDAVITYRVAGGPDAGLFDVVPESGQIYLAGPLILRAAIKDRYEFLVEADDGNGATARIAVVVRILASSVPKEEKFSLAVVDKAIALAAMDIISSRMDVAASGARSLPVSLAGDGEAGRLPLASAVDQWSNWRRGDDVPGRQGERMKLRDFVHEHGFDLSLRRARGPEPRFWGAGSRTSQEGKPVIDEVAVPYDGDVDVLMLGVDIGQEWRRLGLAAASSSAQFAVGEDGSEIEREMVSLHPYLSWQTTRNALVWLAGGYGKGDYNRTAEGRRPENREAVHLSLSGGVRGSWEFRGYELGVGAKMMTARSDLEASERLLLEEVSAESWRTQLDFDVARSFRTANLLVRPFVGGDLRYDSVADVKASAIDARTGVRVNWSKGLSADISGRWQIKDDEMSESSVDGSIVYDYGADQRGLMLSVAPRVERHYPEAGAPSLRQVVRTSAKYRMPVRLFRSSGMVELRNERSHSSDAAGSSSYGMSLSTRRLSVDLLAGDSSYSLKLRIE